MRVCPHCRLYVSEAAHDPCGEATIEVVADVVPPGLSGTFDDVRPFARGSVGTSYLARHRQSGRRGLLKLIAASAVGAGSERMRLQRELRKQTTIDHPVLVPIWDGGDHAGQLWLFREYVEGESLAVRLRRVGALSKEATFAIVFQLTWALDELHRQGLLHRDVKPHHVVLASRPEGPPSVHLIDASLAPRHQSGGVFDLLGTPAYMSPEQGANKLVSFRSDLYSLGCMMYEMLAGHTPFSGDTAALLKAHSGQTPDPLDLDLPERVHQLLADLMAKEPRRRPFSAQQVRRNLEPYLPEGTPKGEGRRRVPTGDRSPAFKGASVPPRAAVKQQPGAHPSDPARPTESLNTSELAQLAVDDYERAAMEGRPITEELQTLELSELVVDGRETGALTIPLPTAADADGDATVAVETAPTAAAASGPDQPVKSAGAAAPSTSARQDRTPLSNVGPRAAVDFDVETLFTDEIEILPDSEAPGARSAARPQPTADAGRSGVPWLAVSVAAVTVALLLVWLVSGDGDGSGEQTAIVAAPAPGLQAPVPELPLPRAKPAATEAPKTTGVSSQAAVEASAAPKGSAQTAAGAPPFEAPSTPEALPGSNDTQEAKAGEAVGAAAVAASPGSPDTATLPAAVAAARTPAAGAKAVQQAKPGPGSSRSTGKQPSGPTKTAAQHKTDARAHFGAARYAKAAAAYRAATRAAPGNSRAFAGLGASWLAAGQAGKAVSAYQRAVKLDPKVSGFHAALGRAYLHNGDRRRAVASYRRAVELNPKNRAAQAALKKLGASK